MTQGQPETFDHYEVDDYGNRIIKETHRPNTSDLADCIASAMQAISAYEKAMPEPQYRQWGKGDGK